MIVSWGFYPAIMYGKEGVRFVYHDDEKKQYLKTHLENLAKFQVKRFEEAAFGPKELTEWND